MYQYILLLAIPIVCSLIYKLHQEQTLPHINSSEIPTENKNPLLRIVSIKPGVVCTPIWNKSVDAVEQSFANVSQEARLKYEKELLFLAENARKNEKKGLQPQCVADAVYKALTHKNPKLSYNVGKDSCFARLMSFLPQGFCNSLIKKGLKCKMAISERK
jgi:hypothetical protein